MAEPIRSVPSHPQIPPGDTSTELSSRRTGMSFQRTRLSADRTLMSVMRTSLSLVSFGFTIFKFFDVFTEHASHAPAARRFGISLVVLGIIMLISGISYQIAFMRGLREERGRMKTEGLIHAESAFPPSTTLVIAVVVLVFALMAIASMLFRSWPFG